MGIWDLPADVWRYGITRFLSGLERTRLSSTCHHMRRALPPPLREMPRICTVRMRASLEARGINSVRASAALRSCGAVLMGGFVLQAIMDASEETWRGDVDILVPPRMDANESGLIYLLHAFTVCAQHVYKPNGKLCRKTIAYRAQSVKRECCYAVRNIINARTMISVGTYPRRIFRLREIVSDTTGTLDLVFANAPLYETDTAKDCIRRTVEAFDLSCCRCIYDGAYCYLMEPETLEWKASVNKDALTSSALREFMSNYMGNLDTSVIQRLRARVSKYSERGFVITGMERVEEAYARCEAWRQEQDEQERSARLMAFLVNSNNREEMDEEG